MSVLVEANYAALPGRATPSASPCVDFIIPSVFSQNSFLATLCWLDDLPESVLLSRPLSCVAQERVLLTLRSSLACLL